MNREDRNFTDMVNGISSVMNSCGYVFKDDYDRVFEDIINNGVGDYPFERSLDEEMDLWLSFVSGFAEDKGIYVDRKDMEKDLTISMLVEGLELIIRGLSGILNGDRDMLHKLAVYVAEDLGDTSDSDFNIIRDYGNGEFIIQLETFIRDVESVYFY